MPKEYQVCDIEHHSVHEHLEIGRVNVSYIFTHKIIGNGVTKSLSFKKVANFWDILNFKFVKFKMLRNFVVKFTTLMSLQQPFSFQEWVS